jgi:hypothetical protein
MVDLDDNRTSVWGRWRPEPVILYHRGHYTIAKKRKRLNIQTQACPFP